MNRNAIIGLIIAGIVVVGGVAYYMSNKDDNAYNSSTTSSNSSSNQATTTENATENGNIYSLTGSGKAQKCTFTYSGTSGNGQGTMYSDGKGRGYMTVEVNTAKGNTGKSYTLLLNDKVYGWSTVNGKSIGFVYDKATIESQTSSSTSNQSQAADPNQKYDLKCEDWSVDENVLKIPEGIKFMSLPTTSQ